MMHDERVISMLRVVGQSEVKNKSISISCCKSGPLYAKNSIEYLDKLLLGKRLLYAYVINRMTSSQDVSLKHSTPQRHSFFKILLGCFVI